MTDLTHDDAAELIGAHALDATPSDEVAALEAHVRACPECAQELAQLRTVAGMIAHTGEDASTSVWDAIAARLDDAPPAHRARPRLRNRVRHVPLRHAVLAATAALIAIGGLSAEIVHLNDQVGSLAASGTNEALVSALDNPESQLVSLMAPNENSGALMRIVVSPDGEAYAFDPALPRLTPNMTYELWESRGGHFVSLGLLGADPHVSVFRTDSLSQRTYYAVTVEHAGGVDVMTHRPIAEGIVQGV